MAVDVMQGPPPSEVFSDAFVALLQKVNSRVHELIKEFDDLTPDDEGYEAPETPALFRIRGFYSPSQKREAWLSDFGNNLVKGATTIEVRSTMSEEEEAEAELQRADGGDANTGNFHVSWASEQGVALPSTFGAPVHDNDQALDNMAVFFQAEDIEFVEA